jgi:hypothetical protein
VIQQFNGTHAPRKSGDMGIDGYSFRREPIQVKRSDRVGRNVVDNFETAVARAQKDRGFIVAFSFTRGAYEEAARAKARARLNISLVTVEELLSGPRNASTISSSLFDVAEIQMPEPRTADSRPSMPELLASGRDAEPDDMSTED